MEAESRYVELRKIFFQILFWGSIWLLVPLFFSNWEYFDRVMTRGLITFFGVATIVFINIKVLLPHVFFKKKYWIYVVLGIAAVALITVGMEWLEDIWLKPIPRRDGDTSELRRSMSTYFRKTRWIGRAMPYFATLLGSALFEIATLANRQEKEAIQLRSEKLEAEMKFLRSQINPHFLFNALNNIYTLTVLKSDDAPKNLLKLSDMLRYVLYDCNADRVPLQREVEYIRHFVELAQLKDSRGLNISLELKVRSNPEVAPMLFIPFIENALKHSRIENIQKSWIKLELQADDKKIRFEIANSVPENNHSKDKVGGIGLQNVKRRLSLIYPSNHELTIRETAGEFHVTLQIDLK